MKLIKSNLDIANNINTWLVNNYKTQVWLAKKLKMTPSALNRYLKGNRTFSVLLLLDIAQACNESIFTFVKEKKKD